MARKPEMPPAWAAAGPDDGYGMGELRVGLHFEEIDGRIECVGVEIWSARPPKRITPDGKVDPGWRAAADLVGHERGLRATDLRSIPLETIVRFELDPVAKDQMRKLQERVLQEARTPKKAPERKTQTKPAPVIGRPQKYDRPTIEKAARIYANALRLQQPATKAVADELDISYKAAERLIARIRLERPELLPPAKKPAKRTAKRK
jgi:hypothetical protein